MDTKIKKKYFTVLLTVIILFLTVLRENLFLEINGIINQQEFNKAYFYWFSDWFNNQSTQSLIILKWLFTVVFVLLISYITTIVIRINFGNEQQLFLIKIYGVTYLILIVLTALFWLFGGFAQGYFILRKIAGVLQSPLPLFIVYALMYLTLKINSK